MYDNIFFALFMRFKGNPYYKYNFHKLFAFASLLSDEAETS